jgi:hypothetical protein
VHPESSEEHSKKKIGKIYSCTEVPNVPVGKRVRIGRGKGVNGRRAEMKITQFQI